MWTLCAFFGIDSKPTNEFRHASAYLASDSYLTDENGSLVQDDSQKVFASLTAPAIFGYTGDYQVATVLKAVIQQLDKTPGLFSQSYGSEARAGILNDFFLAELPASKHLKWDSTIVYIGRSYGDSANQSQFHVWEFTRSPIGNWTRGELKVPEKSGPPMGKNPPFWGSGTASLADFFNDQTGRYKDYKTFSWVYFRALFEALRRRQDKRSGGPIQVAFLSRGGNGEYVGVISDGNKYVCGKPWTKSSVRVSRWVDQDFDECDPNTLMKRSDRKPSPVVENIFE